MKVWHPANILTLIILRKSIDTKCDLNTILFLTDTNLESKHKVDALVAGLFG